MEQCYQVYKDVIQVAVTGEMQGENVTQHYGPLPSRLGETERTLKRELSFFLKPLLLNVHLLEQN